MKKLLAAIVLTTSITAWAGDFEEGQAAYAAKDYGTAVEKFTVAAEQGSVRAQFWLGYMYDEGLGVAQDFAKALRFYRLAAGQGSDLAQLHIGYMYEKGRGVSQDDAEALRWSRLAAAQGLTIVQPGVSAPPVQPNLTRTQDMLQEKEQGYADAVTLYRTLADQGDARAQTNLGLTYLLGRGVEKDETQAMRFLKLAAEQGDARGQLFLGKLYLESQEYMESEYWLKLSAEQGFDEAQLALGAFYLISRETKVDENGILQINLEAVKWLRIAAENGNALAKSHLADLYSWADDHVEAARWRRLLAEQSINDATLEVFVGFGQDAISENFRLLGYAYQNGKGVEQSYPDAVRWLSLAGNRGDLAAQMHLGHMYQQGQTVPPNHIEAMYWFAMAARQGISSVTSSVDCAYGREKNDTSVDKFTLGSRTAEDLCISNDLFGRYFLPCAKSNLSVMFGLMHDQGEIGEQNYAEAVRWYKIAAEQGNAGAQRRLGEMYNQGLGVAQDFIQAYMWFYILSISQREEDKEDLLGPVAKRMKPQDIDQARKSAQEWFDRNRRSEFCEFNSR